MQCRSIVHAGRPALFRITSPVKGDCGRGGLLSSLQESAAVREANTEDNR